MLIAEVNHHGGIPHLNPEEMALRDAIAELLSRGTWQAPEIPKEHDETRAL
jgi:hypothetical protein